MSFWAELKRRNVFKVGAAYVIVAWLIVQVANTFFPLLSFPAWAVPLVAVLVILGFPLAILFAWAFELTPEGIKKTEHVPLEESITHVTGKKLDYILGGLLLIAVAYIVFDNYYLDRRFIESEVASRVAEHEPASAEKREAFKTIAVLPFTDLSPEKDQEYFVDGLSEEILNSLTKIPDLLVTARTSSFTFKNSNKKIQEIASELGVAHILEGSVRKAGNALRITAQLIRTEDGFHLWSETYEREFEDIFDVQEDIATTVADELKVKLGIGESLRQLGGTDNVEAYEIYLTARGMFQQIKGDDSSSLRVVLESLDKAISLDPDFALAWSFKAFVQFSLLNYLPPDAIIEGQESVFKAARKAIEIEPGLSAGYFSLGVAHTMKGEWIQAELAYRKAIELTTDPNLTTAAFPLHYFAVANFTRANELLETARQNDPLNRVERDMYIESLVMLGDTKRVNEENELFGSTFGEKMDLTGFYLVPLEPSKLISTDPALMDFLKKACLGPISESDKKDIKTPEMVLEELHRLFADGNDTRGGDSLYIAMWAAYFGDSELAMDAMEKAISVQRVQAFGFWYPIAKDVRQTRRFKEFVRKIGLVDYWEQFGWPDLCRPLDNGDFVCE